MTWTTTHLALETIILFLLGGTSIREDLLSSKKRFFLISMFAVIPDIDLFFRQHRTITHSFIWPLILVGVGSLFLSMQDQKRKRSGRTLIAGAYLWFFHILLDFGWGPLALFWPIDTRMYDVSLGVIVNFDQFWVLPWTIVGFFIDVQIYSLQQGAQIFIVNLSVEQRKELLGNLIQPLTIDNFFVHASVLGGYVALYCYAGKRQIIDEIGGITKEDVKEIKDAQKGASSAITAIRWKRLRNMLKNWRKLMIPAYSLFFLTLILVNYTHPWYDTNGATMGISYNGTTDFTPFAAVVFSTPEDSYIFYNVSIGVRGELSNLTLMWGLVDKANYSQLVAKTTVLEEEAKSKNWTYEMVFTAYLEVIREVQFITNDTIGEAAVLNLAITVKGSDEQPHSEVVLVTVWENTSSVSRAEVEVQLAATVVRDMSQQLYWGISISLVGTFLTFIPFLPASWRESMKRRIRGKA